MATTRAHFKYANQNLPNPDLTLVIAGAALDGPSKTPFILNPNLTAHDYLGYGPLADAYTMASDAGARRIILYRLNGTPATCTVQGINPTSGAIVNVISLTSVSGSGIYNDILVELDNDAEDPNQGATFLRVTNTNGNIRIYRFADYPTASDLARAINLDSSYGLVEFTAVAIVPDSPMKAAGSWASHFDGGTSGSEMIPDRQSGTDQSVRDAVLLAKTALKEALFGPFPESQDTFEPDGEIGAMDFGLILLADMFYDDEDDGFVQGDMGFGKILGTFCLNKATVHSQGCLGVLGTTPIYSVDSGKVKAKCDGLVPVSVPMQIPQASSGQSSPQVLNDNAPLDVDWKSHLQIVVGDVLAYGSASRLCSLAYAYAGAQAGTPYYHSMTNKTLGMIDGVSYKFDEESVAKLSANGYISIVSSIRKGFVPYSATTFAGLSPYSQPHAIRIGHQIGRVVSNQLDVLVGSNVSNIKVSILQKKLDDMMKPFVDNGVIKQYVASFNIGQTDLPPYEASMLVSIQYTPFNEIRSLGTLVSMPYGGGVINQ